jgi:L-lactate dehydrogenase (cytochrome)
MKIKFSLENKGVIITGGGSGIGKAIAKTFAEQGADFSFLGRTFMYGVSALGKKGGDHTIAMLKTQLTQVMEQLSCAKVSDSQHKLV